MTPDQLRQWRTQHGLSQAKLASQLGVNVATIAHWEQGVRSVPPFLYLALRALELEAYERV